MRLDLRVGIDVGGTNTDAVVLDENNRVLHSELVKEIKTEPDYDAALKALA